MSIIIEALPKRANKNDNEFFYLDIKGKFEKSEVREILGRIDDIIYKQ